MYNQNKKLHKWLVGLFISLLIIAVLDLVIAKAIYPNELEAFEKCLSTLLCIEVLVYLIIIAIKCVQYRNFVEKYEQDKLSEVKEELTSEFQKVFINYSGAISKDEFECKAKVDRNGKIICEIFLDTEITLESYEEFLKYFHLN